MIGSRLLAALSATALLAACTTSQQPTDAEPEAPTPLAGELATKVTTDAMWVHLEALSRIAKANRGNRADGTPGGEASVEYVVNTLRDKGFEVSTPEFSRVETVDVGDPSLTVSGMVYQVDQASLLLPTPKGGLTGTVVQPVKPAGCAAADYRKVPKGAIAVVDDTGCSVGEKAAAASEARATAVLVVSDGGSNGSPKGLFGRNYYEGLPIPVAVIGSSAGAAARKSQKPVKLVLDGKSVKHTSQNVLAQTKTGSTENVVLVGAHLDSVTAGPGMNDNGSGVAAVLETALALGPEPAVNNAVRFAFWGAEERQAAGSIDYVYGLDRDALNDIALYLNFDMVGSPNAGYFTYDGDLSGPADANPDPDTVPYGSAGIERTLAGYLNLAGKRPADSGLNQRSDHRVFLNFGVPVGGITTGADELKTKTQARLWGGKAGQAFDPNYHKKTDTLEQVNRDAMAITGPAVAFAVATYAYSIEGVNGVPARDKRHRTPLAR
ncbi:hypothetical protein MBRU_04240 [Mycolicibacterium brumae DSM 44177]|nr:hypothetical protein MBRU_04240 [Mycolicibacterium brumae DSM 44177]